MGCIYKILAKLLANRMKKVLGRVINHRQSAFIGGRQLLHSVMIANEMVDDAKRTKKCLFFLKLILKRLMIRYHGRFYFICYLN